MSEVILPRPPVLTSPVKPEQALPRVPPLPTRHAASGPRRSVASCTTSGRGTIPMAPWRSTWSRRTPCTPAASRGEARKG